MCVAGGQSGVAHASTVHDYWVVNGTEHPIVLARYKAGKSDDVQPGSRIAPGQKFRFGVPENYGPSLLQIDFDTFDKNDAKIPGGMVELRLNYDRDPTRYSYSVACWPGPNRSCDPRGWRDGDTVVFTG